MACRTSLAELTEPISVQVTDLSQCTQEEDKLSISGGTYEGFFSKSEDPVVKTVFEMAKKEEYGYHLVFFYVALVDY